LLTLRAAARRIGVSPGRFYRAIADGRLQAAPGGRPGKPTLVSLEAVQRLCQLVESLPSVAYSRHEYSSHT
jgi:transposase